MFSVVRVAIDEDLFQTGALKPAIHLASVWDSVDRPLGECLEIVESLEGIAFQRASGMSRILRIQKIRTGVRNQ